MTVAAIGMCTLLCVLSDTGHDQLWLLLASERMKTLNPYGATVFESNPPLAIWLSALVVQAARLLHLPLTFTFKLAVTLVATASAVVSGKFLLRLHSDLTRYQLWLLGIAFIFIFGAVPARDFGQRDHILALLVLPYLISAAHVRRASFPSTMGLLPRTIIALTAALGLALKPHQALIPIAVELTILLGSKPHRPRILEPAVFLASAALYLAAIHTFEPTYFTEVLPVLRDTYWAFAHLNLFELLEAAIPLAILLLIVTVLYLRRRTQSPILLAAGIAATLAYAAQRTGWYYQQLPAISFLALALTLEALTQDSQLKTLDSKAKSFLPIAVGAVTVLAFAFTIHFSHFELTAHGIAQAQPIPDPTFFADLPPGAAVATLTTSVDDTVPAAFRYHLTLAQRYPHLWMLPAILRNESGPVPGHRIPQERLAELDRLQRQFMVDDLNRWHPVLILVERCQDPAVHCQVLEDRHDDLLAWFLRDSAFAAIFAHYHYMRSSGPYDAYVLRNQTKPATDFHE